MSNYLLYSLLGEYARQFQEAIDKLEQDLAARGVVAFERKRVWKSDYPNYDAVWREPTENDPETRWEWKNVLEEYPPLNEIQDVVLRLANFVTGLEESSNA